MHVQTGWLAAVFLVVLTGCPDRTSAPEPEPTPSAASTEDEDDNPRRRRRRRRVKKWPDAHPAAQGLGANDALQVSPDDRCPVCAMHPAKHPKSAAAVVLKDGRIFYYCGNRCLLRARRKPEKYLGVPEGQIERELVLDYFTGTVIHAGDAYWVDGSDVTDAMGPGLVTLKSEEDANRFIQRHGGMFFYHPDAPSNDYWESQRSQTRSPTAPAKRAENPNAPSGGPATAPSGSGPKKSTPPSRPQP